MSELEVWRLAWHEAGHTVWALRKEYGVDLVTIDSANTDKFGALGMTRYTSIIPDPSFESVDNLLAGLAGEELGMEVHGYETSLSSGEFLEAIRALYNCSPEFREGIEFAPTVWLVRV